MSVQPTHPRFATEDSEFVQKVLRDFDQIVSKHIPTDFGHKKIYFSAGAFNNYIVVTFAPSSIAINNVKNQYPHKVALWLNLFTLELATINLGGMGERTIYLTPNAGVNLAYESVTIPFRKPSKAALPEIYKTLDKFCARYVQALKDNVDRLAHKDLLSPVANSMLGLPHYTFVTEDETTIIKSTNSELLNFVGIAMISDFGSVKYSLRIPTSWLSVAQKYIELWYDTSAQATQKQFEILLGDTE